MASKQVLLRVAGALCLVVAALGDFVMNWPGLVVGGTIGLGAACFVLAKAPR